MDLKVETLGLDAARALDPERFRIGGAFPRAALRPASREELSEALRAAARERLSIIPWGGGVALASAAASDASLERYDLALDMTGLVRVIEYNPEDFTLTAECGVTIAALRALLAARGQELPLEAPHAARATLGGVLAANASGPRRLRLGSPRDRILGARFALSDGTIARSGGKVVKNVAGYGIHRLLCGSRGALALIVEASLKLAPAPEKRVALVYGVAAAELSDRSRWSRFPRLEPALVSVIGRNAAARLPIPKSAASFTVVIGLEDDAPWVARQASLTGEVLGAPAARLEGDEAAALWQALADLEEQDGPRLSFTSAENTPAALRDLLDERAAAAVGERAMALAPDQRTGLVFHAPAGRLHLFPDADAAQTLAHTLAGAGFTLIDARGVAGLEPVAPPQAAIAPLRARIRDALDPLRLLALGDRWQAS